MDEKVSFSSRASGPLLSPPRGPFPTLLPTFLLAQNVEADASPRAVTGTLKGYDALMNLVLDDVSETLRDDEGNESSRQLGLVVARGTLLVLVSPCDGSEEIANPFVQHGEDE